MNFEISILNFNILFQQATGLQNVYLQENQIDSIDDSFLVAQNGVKNIEVQDNMLSEDELDFVQTVIDRDDLENIDLNNNNFADPVS